MIFNDKSSRLTAIDNIIRENLLAVNRKLNIFVETSVGNITDSNNIAIIWFLLTLNHLFYYT